MRRALNRALLLAVIGVSGVALLAGCGRTANVSGSSGSPQAGTTAPATPSPAGSQSGGPVTLTLDRQRYTAGATITVMIHNGLSATIWAADHQTSCTVVTAERLAGGQWQAVAGCRLMTPTRLVPLPAGSATEQLLHVQGTPLGGMWQAGTYRVALTYSAGDELTGGRGGVAYSAQFTLG